MKNKLTRKLMLSAFTLLFAVISLGASTYAWFTMSTEAQVEAFEAQVIGGEGFDIAVTERGGDKAGVTWYNGILPTEAIQAVIPSGFKFDACTPQSAQLTANETFKTQKEALDKASTSSATGFITFDLHFRLTDKETPGTWQINFTNYELNVVDGTAKEWTADVAYEVANAYAEGANPTSVLVGDKLTYDVSNAARIAIVGTGYSCVFEKPADNTSKTGNSLGFTEKGALDYYNNKSNTNYELPAQQYTANTNSTVDGSKLPTLAGENVVTLTVYVWLEGWDGECMNPIFSQKLSTQLGFNITKIS